MGHPEGGMLFKGTKGYITGGVYGDNARLLPAERMDSFMPPEQTLPRIESHEKDWTDAIRNGTKAGADFAYSGPLTETVLLGNIAKRMSTRIDWNSEKLEVENLPEANQYVHKEYREGWSL
jgi:hypothetical protein